MKATAICAAALFVRSVQAGTTYLGKAYNGSKFWAAAHCNQHNSLIERIEHVADVPWDQQVQQAEKNKAAQSQQAQADTGELQRMRRCAQLVAERSKTQGRYTNWQWQPSEVINPQQQRMRGLRAELAANRCSFQ